MSVCACGAPADEGDRFCRSCGRALGDQRDLVPLIEPDAPISVENVSVGVRHGPSRVLVILALGAMVALAWTLVAARSDEGPPPNGEAAPTTDRLPAPTDGPERTTVTSISERGTDPTPDPGTAARDGSVEPSPGPPPLGVEVGYRLLISTTSRPVVIDLDTGTTRYSEGTRVFPVAVADPWLIINRATPGGLARLPLDDLAAEPVPVFAVEGAATTFVASPTGQVTPRSILVNVIRPASNPSEFDETLYVVDPTSGQATEQPDTGLTFDFGGIWADPQNSLLTGPSGGVYARTTTDDGYRRVADGRLLTADARRALVQTCDSALRCTLTWFDRQSWEPLDLHVPDDQQATVVMLHETDWLLEATFGTATRASLLNITTGVTREVRTPEFGFRGGVVLPAVSPDGQWLAEVTDQPRVIAITNLTTDETTEITLSEAATQPLFFIET